MNTPAVRRAAGTLLVIVPLAFTVCFSLLQQLFEYPDILRQPTAAILTRFAAGGAGGLVLAVGIAAGLAEPAGWALGGTINTYSYLVWSVWLIALGVILLLRRADNPAAARPAAVVPGGAPA